MSNYDRTDTLSRRPGPGPVRPHGTNPIARFARDESGAMLIFGLFLFVIMLMVGGLAVDLMRYEAERTKVQNTADTAALAAASMRQLLDPEDVVADYFEKAGVGDKLSNTVVDEWLNYRNVRVETGLSVRSYFMHMVGIDKLESTGVGAAEERKTNVEIALVLDISGSMQGSRIISLREAAMEFVEKVLADDTENRVSISLVPYNGQVNLPPWLRNKFNVTHPNNVANSNCVDLPASVYNSVGLSRTLPMSETAYADTFSTVSTAASYQAPQAPLWTTNIWCPVRPNNFVRVHENNANLLKTQIASLEAVGATSIDAGLKWGAMLLDPSSRPLIQELAGEGHVPAHFVARPFSYDDPEVLKVIVLMTDGEHFAEERVNDAYKTTNLSPIWRNTASGSANGQMSIHHLSGGGGSGSNRYYYPHNNTWNNRPWGAVNTTNMGTAKQLTWREVWTHVRVHWVAWQLYGRALGGNNATSRAQHYNTALNNFRSLTPTGPKSVAGTMDHRLLSLCEQVKARNVWIFGIAFEAPAGGRDIIRDCATENRFYDVDGEEIKTAFRQIRSQISSLRLTQ